MAILWNKNIKEFVWTVVSTKMDKTLVVLVKRVKIHPIYKKRFVVRKKFYVHNESFDISLDDTVKIRECNPISKLKRWLCVGVV